MTKNALLLVTSLWLAAVSCGVVSLTLYEYTPGRPANIPSDWPGQSIIPHAVDLPTLIVFAHPECPCTRASIGELSVLMTHCQNRVKAYVLFLRPKGRSEDWLRSDLWRSAATIPGVVVQADEDGNEAARFHATTSGQVVLYGIDGKLIFRGGITSSRGHYGDNTGLSTIASLLNHEIVNTPETPVFGCSLLDPKSDRSTGSITCKR